MTQSQQKLWYFQMVYAPKKDKKKENQQEYSLYWTAVNN